jgi:Tfp pilus assembly protein PilE
MRIGKGLLTLTIVLALLCVVYGFPPLTIPLCLDVYPEVWGPAVLVITVALVTVLPMVTRGLGHRSPIGARVEAVVVAVVWLLYQSIVLPGFLAYRDRARQSALTTELQQVATAIDVYYQEHHAYTGATRRDVMERGYRPSAGVTMRILEAGRDHVRVSASSRRCGRMMSVAFDSRTGQIARTD